MLTLQQIINEAKTMIPNEFQNGDFISWLNAINQDFFNVVKIPKIYRFTTVQGQSEYSCPSDVRAKNINLVQDSYTKYQSIMEDDVRPSQTFWAFDDETGKLTLTPAPLISGLAGVLRYHRIATTTFTTSNLNVTPDAPPEYHWTYVPALCERIALAMDDGVKAANFANQYRSAWNVAAANYAGESA